MFEIGRRRCRLAEVRRLRGTTRRGAWLKCFVTRRKVTNRPTIIDRGRARDLVHHVIVQIFVAVDVAIVRVILRHKTTVLRDGEIILGARGHVGVVVASQVAVSGEASERVGDTSGEIFGVLLKVASRRTAGGPGNARAT